MATETVVVIVPTYNEKGNIERLIEWLEEEIFPQVPDQFIMHILVVDDNSPDGTADVVKKLSTKYPSVHLLINPTKAGLGNAYTKGMRFAISQLKADIVFEFDADFSHDATKIPLMLTKLTEGYDMVVGSRYIQGGSIPDNWGWHRKFLSVVGNWVARIIITDFGIHDWTGGFRGIRTKVIEAVLPQLNRDEFMGYTFQVGFMLQARRAHFAITEIPFHFKDRTLGKSKMPAEYMKKTLFYILQVRMKEIAEHRLFKFAMVGIMGAVVQLTSLQLGRIWFPYQLAYFISVELAVLSNFIWSNLWTFNDRVLKTRQIPGKFLQFNFGSAGSILIQQGLAFLVERYIGLKPFFIVDTGLFFAIVGIGLGMFWNYFIYTRLIWTKPNSSQYALK